MVHDTFGTIDLDMLATMLWEAGWDYELGTIYRKGDLRGTLEMRHDHYVLRDVATAAPSVSVPYVDTCMITDMGMTSRLPFQIRVF